MLKIAQNGNESPNLVSLTVSFDNNVERHNCLSIFCLFGHAHCQMVVAFDAKLKYFKKWANPSLFLFIFVIFSI